MIVSIAVDYGTDFPATLERAAALEDAGLDRIWVPEAYGFDAASQLGFLAARTTRLELGTAVVPVFARPATSLAMMAASIDTMSGGRFSLGIGASGAPVVEGFYGVPYDRPLARIRDTVAICRSVWWRSGPISHAGERITLPLPPDQGTGQGRAIKPMARPLRPRIPIWLAALGPRSVALAAEVADGWLPTMFIPELATRAWGDALADGAARRGPELARLEIAAGGVLAIGAPSEVEPARQQVRLWLARLLGGMGSATSNHYRDLAHRYGFGERADAVYRVYVADGLAAAAELIPPPLVDGVSLIGTRDHVAARLEAYRAAGVTDVRLTLAPTAGQSDAHLLEIVKEIV